MSEVFISAISIGQIAGLFIIMEMFYSRRSSRYIGRVLVLVGALPIIKIFILKPDHIDKLSYLAMNSGIIMVVLGVIWLLLGNYRQK